jgi:hypothetical protein
MKFTIFTTKVFGFFLVLPDQPKTIQAKFHAKLRGGNSWLTRKSVDFLCFQQWGSDRAIFKDLCLPRFKSFT